MNCAFVNGKVLTADARDTVAEAALVCGRRIRAVGSEAEVRAAAGRGCKIFNMAGGTLLPGFFDAHNHLTLQGAALGAPDFGYPRVSSVAALREAVRAAARRTAKGRWIRGWGMNYEKYPDGRPGRRDIDAVSPNHPVCITHVSGHFALVNSAALRLAGVDDNTPDPSGGALIRDGDGRLTGLAQDSARRLVAPSGVKVGRHGPDIGHDTPLDELVDDIDRACRAYLAAGITSVADPQVTTREMPGYIAARDAGKLRVRTTCMYLSNHMDALNELGVTGAIGDDRLSIGPVKFYCDGTLIGGTALFYEDDGPPGGECKCAPRGRTYWEDIGAFQEALVDTHRRGLQFGVHTQGDKALNIVLDAAETARRRFPRRDARHRIEHCHGATAAQVRRLKRLEMLPVTQPGQLYETGDDLAELYGEERARSFCRLRAMLDAGVPAVVSTDAFVQSYKPFHAIAAAVNRVSAGGLDMGAAQRISLPEAVRCYTRHAARSVFQERDKGSVEAGKLADLVFVPRDLLSVPADEIADLAAGMTMVDGEVVHGEV